MPQRTPVLVGVGAVNRVGFADPVDALDVMLLAAEEAYADAGAPVLRERVGLVLVPRGTWRLSDPGRQLAPAARTVIGEVGVLQQTLVTRACAAIAAGEVDVAVVCGAEAKHSARLAPPPPAAEGDGPDETLRPDGEILTRVEIERGLAVPAHEYAVVESALRRADERTPAEHREHLGALWAGFAEVAAGNPDAWNRSAPAAHDIANAGPGNRMVAAPYTKLLCSQWNVDQGAALVLASAEAAGAAGVPDERWVFPLAAAESNLIVPLPERRHLHRWPAFAAAAEHALTAAGVTIDDVDHLDLYSCFPAAVQVQAAELGLPLDRPLTVTGGMTFAGGPLNNYVLQATVTMARRLRDEPGAVGMVTCVSGLLTKPAVAIWSTQHRGSFTGIDVTEEAAVRSERVPLDGDTTGTGTIVGYTVLYENDAPARAVAIVDLDGTRTVAVCDDAATAAGMVDDEWVGRPVDVVDPGRFSVS